jgi:alpha-L-fucosidase
MIPALRNEVISTKFLASGTKLKITSTNEGAVLEVPGKSLDSIATVIKLEVKGDVAPIINKPNEKPKAAE